MFKHLLAVYGTLKKNFHNNFLLKDSKFLGTFKTKPEFTMVSMGGFPAITDNGSTEIEFELFEITDESVLKQIYRLEGYSGTRNSNNNWYDTLDVDTDYGKAEIFYMKNMDVDEKYIIENGVWV